jgi:arylsulfatase A-like enzyme
MFWLSLLYREILPPVISGTKDRCTGRKHSMKITRRAALAGLAAAPALSRAAGAPPNILLILSDDHSVPYLGAYGASWMSTPNLDAFARDGMRSDRAFTAAPQCVPSRAAIMTGRSPVAVRMGRFSSPLHPDIVTLPEVLRERGYFTGVCGRYFHLDGPIKAGKVTQPIMEKHGLRTWARRIDYMDVSPQNRTPDRFGEFLGKVPKGRPWFFWINYSDPHHVWDKDAGSVDPARIQVPPHLPDLPGVREDLARYCGEIERMDRLFAETTTVLGGNSLEENTLVVFMGDNGMAFPHGKGSLYDPGLNVPLLARWPQGVKAGGNTRHLISGEDIAPTLIEAAGGTAVKDMSGRSFFNLLTGRPYEPRKFLFAARLHHGNAPYTPKTRASGFDLSRCARSDRWKLIYNCTPHMEYWPVDSGNDPGWRQILAAHREGKLKPEHERAYFSRPRPVTPLSSYTIWKTILANSTIWPAVPRQPRRNGNCS